MEPITRVATTSHFLLMFGYKLFSFFFPLYLAQQGFSLPQVGYTYLLIYLPIAIMSPFAGWLNTKVHPLALTMAGIAGYAAYSLAMLATPTALVFYTMQVVLGIAAACFFVSLRSLLIGADLKNPDSAFGYFYAAPNAAEAVAPALGALLIFLFGFSAVFLASFTVHIANMCYLLLKSHLAVSIRAKTVSLPTWLAYKTFGKKLVSSSTWLLLLVSFAVLFVGGLYQPFFILFLDHLGWTERGILIYGAVFSIIFVPISYLVAKYALGQGSRRNMYMGSFIYAGGSILFGLLARRLEAAGIMALAIVRGTGGLVTNAGRSGYLSRSFPNLSEPAGVIDTALSPLGTALGALAGGFLLTRVDFDSLFTQAGVLIIAIAIFALLYKRTSQ